ncbi:MurR/RpiR family transcriptional regulator [Cetobacterium somerae]|uniref:MurR/RpiR family transcriptional regulator n=1 Tax=Cetobacterium sp. NK01 TaxID=2993530 RepID=UPI0021171345|nr:MurR/RpiR family transcriptional regulator [Cetobacterium sp. NK01]MCQ8211077.1 MurR/RpiR family transcriptional regulator [Cetobacterium sp. NK01]
MGGTLIKLKEFQESFTKNEKKISYYLLENIDEIKVLNTYDLAVKCDVSQASIVRFAKKLGFKGFPEFKIALAGDLAMKNNEKEIQIIYDEIRVDDTTEVLAKKVVYENIKSVEDTYKVLNFQEIEKAVESIEKADRIFLLGAGFSGIIARDFQYKLWELGKNVIFETDQHIQLTNASTAKKGDLVFVISYSGQTLDIYQTILEFKERGVTVITLTKFATNPIKDIGNIALSTIVEKSNLRSTSLSSRMAQLTVIDILYVKLIQRDREKANKFIGDAVESVKKYKM